MFRPIPPGRRSRGKAVSFMAYFRQISVGVFQQSCAHTLSALHLLAMVIEGSEGLANHRIYRLYIGIPSAMHFIYIYHTIALLSRMRNVIYAQLFSEIPALCARRTKRAPSQVLRRGAFQMVRITRPSCPRRRSRGSRREPRARPRRAGRGRAPQGRSPRRRTRRRPRRSPWPCRRP